ncbi:MAG TPA: hypothetical protein VET23_05525, partial [Chitinophagaceae bacterium]|nr:hypothetical protein [Chitinophagaceae bacterium]
MRRFLFSAIAFINSSLLFAQQQINLPEARFKTGNDKKYSQPGFDDSKWQILKTNELWDEQGFKDYDGYAWYRFHVNIPSSLKKYSFWKDSLRIDMAKIDDADEVYLNGTLIGKKGSFPNEPGGYVTSWDQEREYHIATTNPAILWDAENIIAVKVYDGGGLGGIYGGTPYINIMDLIDGIKISFRESRADTGDKLIVPFVISNNIREPVSGLLKLRVLDTETDQLVK